MLRFPVGQAPVKGWVWFGEVFDALFHVAVGNELGMFTGYK